MTITNENIARARDLLNTIENLGHTIELMAQAIEDDDRLAAAIAQIGTIIREKAEAADILLGGPADVREALVAAIKEEMAQYAD